MNQVFLIGCPHLGHENMYSRPFFKEDGVTPLRPFKTSAEADEFLLEKYNSMVKPDDKVYWLGDICFGNKHLQKLSKFNGRKILIKGNHDNLKVSEYTKYFKDIRTCHVLDKYVLTHIPVHPCSLDRWGGNLHSHLHIHKVKHADGSLDGRYVNISVEHNGHGPISYEDAIAKFF